MDKELKKNLVARLLEEKTRLKSIIDGHEMYNISLKHYNVDEELIDNGYITNEQYAELIVVYNVLISNNITNDDLLEILKSRPLAFSFIKKLNRNYVNLANELLTRGPKWIVLKYCADRKFKEACKPSFFA